MLCLLQSCSFPTHPPLSVLLFASIFQEDEDDDRILQIYRERRIADLKEAQKKNRFGDVNEISKGDWVKEVTEESNSCWVVTHLFQDSYVECQLMDETIATLAKKFPMVKFLRIKSTHAVENWPERNLPTLFLYHNGELQHQIMTLHSLGGTAMVPDGEFLLLLAC